ncbi:MAG: carboxymuconolactone decarboxylase family protein [Anaerolineae bacterium]
MAETRLEHFRAERAALNETVMAYANQGIKRFFNLDWAAYQPGALDVKTKELLGLVASLVLRCDDCITYHIDRCLQEGVRSEELVDALNIGLIVGGSITIPHLRRALQTWDEALQAGLAPDQPANTPDSAE